MNRIAWRATVHKVTKSQTWLKQLSSTHTVASTFEKELALNHFYPTEVLKKGIIQSPLKSIMPLATTQEIEDRSRGSALNKKGIQSG